jgi:membrane associated rhomboid family serine protease
MAGIVDELKETYKTGNSLIKLIFINSAVFILFRIIYIFYFFTGQAGVFPVTGWLSLPSTPGELLYRPWTLITYMFYHEDIFHFIFNLLNLFWFGKIFLFYFDEKKLTSLYLLGGITGGLFYFAVYNLFPGIFHPALLMGASASIITIMIASAFYAPNFKVNMLFLGEVKLIYIGIFSIVLYIILIASDNPGGNLAHLGGAFLGYLWAIGYKKGKDFTSGFSRFLSSFFLLFKRNKLKVSHKRAVDDFEFNRRKLLNQKEIDRILDKISKAGYESLTKDEKDTLFQMGNKPN